VNVISQFVSIISCHLARRRSREFCSRTSSSLVAVQRQMLAMGDQGKANLEINTFSVFAVPGIPN
jgi:hypothetical protein